MKVNEVEAVCGQLSELTKNNIRRRILKYEASLPETYSFGEAIVFWISNLLIGTKLLTVEQLFTILEDHGPRILAYGKNLSGCFKPDTLERLVDTLPVFRIGLSDRRYVSIDNCDYFIDLTTGGAVYGLPQVPLETVVYNLSTLFFNTLKIIKRDQS